MLSRTNPAALAAEQAISYGRAGGAVGADRIQQLAGVKGRGAQTGIYPTGTAVLAVGSERVQQLAGMKAAPVKVYPADPTKRPRVVYDRAGVPLPFGTESDQHTNAGRALPLPRQSALPRAGASARAVPNTGTKSEASMV